MVGVDESKRRNFMQQGLAWLAHAKVEIRNAGIVAFNLMKEGEIKLPY
jgi:hypothetical protein